MHKRICLIALGLAFGCSSNSIALKYAFPVGRTDTYSWTIEAITDKNTSSEVTHEVFKASGFLTETILRATSKGRMIVRLDMRTSRATLDGEPRTLHSRAEIEIDRDGRAIRVMEAEGTDSFVDAQGLLAALDPQLPPSRVKIGQGWNSPVRSRTNSSAVTLDGKGKLEGFDLRQHKRLALIAYRRHGTAQGIQRVGNIDLELKGTSTEKMTTSFAIDDGSIFDSIQDSETTFDVGSPSGGPGSKKATIVVRISTKLKRMP
ncbi:MAG: hypothetical protein LC723_08030 [Actinobacteria bacterium]|nr:hypothetical protein [Actinomycetota bacterium]